MTYIPEDVRADLLREAAYDQAVDRALERGECINLDEEVAVKGGLCSNCVDPEPTPEPPPVDGYEYL